MTSATSRSQGASWVRAAGLALVVHAVVVLLVAWVRPFEATAVARADPPPLDIVFAPTPAPPEPPRITQVPESHERPEPSEPRPGPDPELLANVASEARDVVSGTGDAPAGDDPDDPWVELRSAPETPIPTEVIESPDPDPTPGAEADLAPTRADPRQELGRRAAPHPLPASATGVANSQFDQELRTRGAGLTRVGASVRLSTTDWEFSPWVEAFIEKLRPNWIVPSGYKLGIIHGWTRVLLQIERDGTLSRIEVVDEEGHRALHVASVDALRFTAPFKALPERFPAARLLLEFTMEYPELHRPAPRRRTPASRR